MARSGDPGRGRHDPAGLMRGLCQLLGCVLATLLALNTGCSSYSTHAPLGDRSSRQTARTADTYTVQRGDTLFAIAWKNGLDYQTVAAWNRIAAPYTIYPGQRILLRAPGVDRQHAPPSSAAARAVPPLATSAPSPPAVAADADPMPAWQWPTDGPILRRFDGDATGKKGISIGGTHGNLVRAAAPGQVVYAGSGLVGYGRLIIIKHNDTYLSAYGHNRNLRVNEGDTVRSQQVIADMGSSGTNRIQLHFEIRRKGKPVDPLRYLPRR